MRLVPAEEPTPMTLAEGQAAAQAAYTRAKAEQRALASHMPLLELLHRPGSVSYTRLRGERHEARAQLERAQAVLAAVDDTMAALEAVDLT